MKIIHLKHKEIDKKRWDSVISLSRNSKIYAFSWYLDAVSPNWEALVTEDYTIVMPLPKKKKYGISYLIQPQFTQQLGVFSEKEIEETILNQFIKSIPYWLYLLQINNAQSQQRNGVIRVNYILQLNKNYKELFSNYSPNTKRNIKKATASNLAINKLLDFSQFVQFISTHSNLHNANSISILERLYISLEKQNAVELWGAYENEELISTLFFAKDNSRYYNLIPISSEKGKENKSMFKIIDSFIQEKASSELILDFEGSMIPGVARFYEGWGSKKTSYQLVKRNFPQFIFR